MLGRAEGCDIRIQLPVVSKEHAKLRVKVQESSVSFNIPHPTYCTIWTVLVESRKYQVSIQSVNLIVLKFYSFVGMSKTKL